MNINNLKEKPFRRNLPSPSDVQNKNANLPTSSEMFHSVDERKSNFSKINKDKIFNQESCTRKDMQNFNLLHNKSNLTNKEDLKKKISTKNLADAKRSALSKSKLPGEARMKVIEEANDAIYINKRIPHRQRSFKDMLLQAINNHYENPN